MAEIVRVLAGTQPTDAQPAEITKPVATTAPLPATLPRLTFEAFEHPAFMVNKRFELEWWNEAAERALLDLLRRRPATSGPAIFSRFSLARARYGRRLEATIFWLLHCQSPKA